MGKSRYSKTNAAGNLAEIQPFRYLGRTIDTRIPGSAAGDKDELEKRDHKNH